LYREYKDRVAFYVVYIQEAHASDSWRLAGNVSVATPRSFDERGAVASSCVRKLGIDGVENTTESAYTGWPDRLYLIDRQGHVAYKSGPGPFGFHPSELKSALERTAPGVKTAQR
jgi:type I thyroxine 5'-deiodinase